MTEQDGVMDPETRSILNPDDYLIRMYRHRQTGALGAVFVAYFNTQRRDKAPHSPKNCLPGSGWTPSSSAVISIRIPGQPLPIRVNRYLVAKGSQKSVVLYWYQTWNRVIASEYMAKIYLVTDSIRYSRSDTALVRITLPVPEGLDRHADEAAVDFALHLYPLLGPYLPPA